MYSKIVNPINGKQDSITSQEGKTILKKYLFFMKGGSSSAHSSIYDFIKKQADSITPKTMGERDYNKFVKFLIKQEQGQEMLMEGPWVPITRNITDKIKGLVPGGDERKKISEKRFDELLRDYAQLLAEHESEVLSLHDKRRKLGRSVYLPPDFVVT